MVVEIQPLFCLPVSVAHEAASFAWLILASFTAAFVVGWSSATSVPAVAVWATAAWAGLASWCIAVGAMFTESAATAVASAANAPVRALPTADPIHIFVQFPALSLDMAVLQYENHCFLFFFSALE